MTGIVARWIPWTLLLLGLAVRIGYVLGQPAADPGFARPALDGAYYWEWAGALASGEGRIDGAFYLAPLYPYLLALFRTLFGEAFGLLYGLQHLAVVVAAGLFVLTGRRLAGEWEGLAAGALLLLYQTLADGP